MLNTAPPTFNVLADPWIPVVRHDAVQELGILEVLQHAHDLDTITDPSPAMEFGLYRLLTVFIQDCFELKNLSQLVSLLNTPRFDMDRIGEYVERVGRQRFDLFDIQSPFLQTPPTSSDKELYSVTYLFQHLPSGSNHIHFHHIPSAEQAISPAVCARALTTFAPFMTQGGRGFSPSINGAPPWYVQVRGRSLFHTLLLNVFANDTAMALGVPAWRAPLERVPKGEHRCRGLLEGLTWQPRVVSLIPGDGGQCTYTGRSEAVLVRTVHRKSGFKNTNTSWRDPNVAYAYRKPKKGTTNNGDTGPLPLRPSQNRAPWRDTGPLFLLHEPGEGGFIRPAVVTQLRLLQQDEWMSSGNEECFDLYGLRTKQDKIWEWHHERFVLPSTLQNNPGAGPLIQRANQLAEEVAACLGEALKHSVPQHVTPGGRLSAAVPTYWTQLEPLFWEWLQQASECDPQNPTAFNTLLASWATKTVGIARTALTEAVGFLDTNARALRRQQDAVTVFERRVNTVLHPKSPATSRRRHAQ